jgi:hypothetical protein
MKPSRVLTVEVVLLSPVQSSGSGAVERCFRSRVARECRGLSDAADTAGTAVGNAAHTAVKSTGNALDSAGNSIGNRAKNVTQ